MKPTTSFRITHGKGFGITFPNGYSVSVQWGIGNYCDNQRLPFTPDYDTAQRNAGERGSTDAEVAIRLPNGELMYREDWGDSVKGWVSPLEVLTLMNEVAAYDL
jgi:hypothetical protein